MTSQEIQKKLGEYLTDLTAKELSGRTREKYCNDILRFLTFCSDNQLIEKAEVMKYKQHLLQQYKVSTVNSYLISLNRYLSWLNHTEYTVKTIRMQRKTGLENVITREEYSKLMTLCLDKGRDKNYLLLRTLAGTGIRVGELGAVTRETVEQRMATITHKGKCRCIFFSAELSHLLLDYCRKHEIQSGIIFYGKQKDTVLHPSSVWKALKRTAIAAGVNPDKVYPHSLRHLFAKTYMEKVGNIFELADLLGHSSVETTRIYALTSNEEKLERMEELML